MGRPTKLTPEVRDAIIEALSLGAHIDVACGAVGIGATTFYRWMGWGDPGRTPKDDDPEDLAPYVEFRSLVTAASNRVQLDALRAIRSGWEKEPELALKFLKQRYPGQWNVGVQRLEHSAGTPGSASLTEEERLAERLALFMQGAADGAAAGALIEAERAALPAGDEPRIP